MKEGTPSMRRYLPAILICAAVVLLAVPLVLASCGGGNEANSNSGDTAYIPDFTTPEGATEAFARAIETGNANLMSLAIVDEERAEVLPEYQKNFEAAKNEGTKWKLEVKESDLVPGEEARALFKYIGTKDGKEQSVQGAWAVFIKTKDGSWKYSRRATRHFTAELLRKENEDNPSGTDGETPADGAGD